MRPLRAVAAPPPTIPVYRPDLSGNEKRYVVECLDTTWISSLGGFIERFEAAVREATGADHATGLCNGTVALHLALHCLGVGPGDEVIVPTFTYIASVNTIAQCGATPVFADIDPVTLNLDPDAAAAAIGGRTRALLPVHIFGYPADMLAFERHGLPIRLGSEAGVGEIVEATGRDKKRTSEGLGFVLCPGPGEVLTDQRVEPSALRAAVERLR